MVIDFFTRLALYGIKMSSVQVYKKRHDGGYSFYSFSSLEQLKSFYQTTYYPFEMCEGLGDIWLLNMFTVSSSLDRYTMDFRVWDIGTGEWQISDASQYDTCRNSVWTDGKERQRGLIDRTVAEYWGYYQEIYTIFLHGVYSPCYAVPPWTEYTVVLHSYKDYFIQPEQMPEPKKKTKVVINNI